MEYTYIGKDTPTNNSNAKASGSLLYAGDMHLPNMHYMKLVLSPVAHGMVESIDASQALAVPGVKTVLSWENTSHVRYNRGKVRTSEEGPDQETVFSRHVRFVGDRVAAVVAETPEAAQRAAALVKLTIRELPAVFDPAQAMEPEAPQLHEEGNVIRPGPVICGDYDTCEGTEFVHHSKSQRISHITMETHCSVADYDPFTDRMVIWSPTQSVFGVRSAVANILGMTMSHIRVLKTPMGGSFGCKQEMILEPLVACAAKKIGHPVMLRLDRRETMLCTVLKHPVESEIHVKFSEDLRLQGLRLYATLDAGAYQSISPDYAMSMSKKLSWVYHVKDIEYYPATVCTNNPVSGSYRGWGGPETALIMENMMNAAARRFGVDPVELRLRSALPPYAVSKIGNYSLGDLRLQDAILQGRERFRWEERKQRLAKQNRNGRFLRGIGMAVSTHTSGYYPRRGDWGTVVVKMEEDGSVHVNCNVHDHGCGTVATFKNIVAETLSIDPCSVDIPEGDTAYNAIDNGCYTSRTVYVLGRAVQDAAEKLRMKLIGLAAKMLSCLPERLSTKNGRVFRTDEPSQGCTYSEIAYYSADHGDGALFVSHTHIPTSNPGPAAAHFAEVEVDTDTGMCRVVSYLAVHDVGCALNPAACRGQVGSAVQQGMGFVFCEELRIDKRTGQALNADMQRYHVVRACDIPELDIVFIENGDEEGPFGAKSIGESCFVPVAPALIAAVNDALHTELSTIPLEPAAILSAIGKDRLQHGEF